MMSNYGTDRGKPPTRIQKSQQRLQTRSQQRLKDPRENVALLASIIDSALDAILVLDERQNIALFNSAAEVMFGASAVDVIGKPLNRFLPGDIGAWHKAQVEQFGERYISGYAMGAARVTTGARENGAEFPIEVSVSVFVVGERKYYTAIIRDISARMQVEGELRHMSTHDTLTGLYNRFYFEEEINRFGRGRPPYPITIMIADVDGLKNVNDRFGHMSGDELIQAVAEVLKSAFRTEDVVARLGGDEFGVILHNSDRRITESAIQRIYDRLWQLNRKSKDIHVGVSIGVATYQEGETMDETIRRADRAMYRHKNGKGHMKRL